MIAEWCRIGQMLGAMMAKPDKFCTHSPRLTVTYFSFSDQPSTPGHPPSVLSH